MNWELVIAGTALGGSLFSIGFTIYKTRKSNQAETESYRFRVMTSMKKLSMTVKIHIAEWNVLIEDYFSTGNDVELNSKKENLLLPITQIDNEIKKHAKKITDYKNNNDIDTIRKIELEFITTEEKYKLVVKELDKLFSSLKYEQKNSPDQFT